MRGEVEGSVGPTIVAKSPPKIDVPKFENKFLDDVAKYLDLFEKVMQQNQYDETAWPLALRTAVVGSKLEAPLVSIGGTYEGIKKEVLLAHGQTADKLWKQLITTTQESESFRQWCVRIATKLVQFILAGGHVRASAGALAVHTALILRLTVVPRLGVRLASSNKVAGQRVR